ncbi:MAG: pyridoxamine 5'-phosphate oxidase family protein [Prevotellaceae bacterium]|jgi:uncharacterized protein YhbP (UPF0306 family)|nr:pyridoxamine 5'-phosphate oxidase family protein [Prevotellaceae bacterium]
MNFPQPFIDVINAHHVLTLATCVSDEPYCSSVFYAFFEEENCFVFSSESNTKHVKDLAHNMCVAANIALETEAIGKIQGVQIQGLVHRPEGELLKRAKKAYMRRFPYAALISTTFWVLEPTWAKLTDNRLGFGKKLTWEKEALVATDFLNEKYSSQLKIRN